MFEAFGILLAANLDSVRGVFVNLSQRKKTVCKLTLESLRVSLSEEEVSVLSGAGVQTEIICEDGVSYISFILPERGTGV